MVDRTAAPSRHPGGTAATTRLLACGVVLTLVVALVAALWATGAASAPPLADPGPVVRWGLPVVTGLGRGAAALTIGALVLCVGLLSPAGQQGRAWRYARRAAFFAAASWLLLQGLLLHLTFRDVLGGGAQGAWGEQFVAFLDLDLGRTLANTTVLTGLVAVGAFAIRRPGAALAVLLLALTALLQQADMGHTSGTTGHDAAVLGVWLHTVAACVWVGGLAMLVLVSPYLRRTSRTAAPGRPAGSGPTSPGSTSSWTSLSRVAGRYSLLAAWAYAVLALSGLFSLIVRVTSLGDLVTTPWGRLLLVKVVILCLLGLIGARHRRHTLPLLQRGHPRTFRRLAAGELLVMSAVLGLSSALARTEPPLMPHPAGGPVVDLTGYAAPPALTIGTFLTQVRVEPVTLLIAGAALLAYLLGVRRLWASGVPWPWHRTLAALVGAASFAGATNGGLAVYGSVLLSAHVVQHLALVAILPIAYVLAAPGTLARHALTPRDDGSLGPREWLDAVSRSRTGALLARPGVAAVHVGLALAVLHLVPVLRHLTLTSQVVHLLVVLYLSVIGYLLVTALLRARRASAPDGEARLLLLVPYLVVGAALGVYFLVAGGLVGPDFYAQLSLAWLTDPLTDQRRAGVLVWALVGLSALALTVAPGTGPVYHRSRARAPGSV